MTRARRSVEKLGERSYTGRGTAGALTIAIIAFIIAVMAYYNIH